MVATTERQLVVQELQTQLKEIGVELRITKIPPTVNISTVGPTAPQTGESTDDLALYDREVGLDAWQDLTNILTRPSDESWPDQKFPVYANADVSEWLKQTSLTLEPLQRGETIRKIQQQFKVDLPILTLFTYPEITITTIHLYNYRPAIGVPITWNAQDWKY